MFFLKIYDMTEIHLNLPAISGFIARIERTILNSQNSNIQLDFTKLIISNMYIKT